jgi:all-trans-retinol dehydrogenase (NAD+)
MAEIKGKTILVTGGASGIGMLLARRLLACGAAQLLIWDVQQAALERVVLQLREEGHQVFGQLVDLADPQRIQAVAQEVKVAGLTVDILINNAGIVTGKVFVEHSTAEIAATMAVNALAPMYVAREFLPDMLARRSGHIVNMASAAGLVSNPKMSVYCASKWAVTGWSDSLRIELERDGTGVGVTTVMPYYIDTGMFCGVRSPVIPILRPEYVADRIIAAIKSDRILLRLPWLLNFVPLLRGLLPARWFDKIGGQWLGIYHTMDEFKGRQ